MKCPELIKQLAGFIGRHGDLQAAATPAAKSQMQAPRGIYGVNMERNISGAAQLAFDAGCPCNYNEE